MPFILLKGMPLIIIIFPKLVRISGYLKYLKTNHRLQYHNSLQKSNYHKNIRKLSNPFTPLRQFLTIKYQSMKKISLFVSALLISTLSFAQTAEEVINNYVTAIGGKDAISKIKDLTMTYTGEVQGASLEVIIQKKAPNKFIQAVNVTGMGEVQKQVCDGTKVRASGMQGSEDITDPEKVKAVALQAVIVPESEYTAMGAKLTYIGKEKVNTADAHKIEVTIGTVKMTEYYDAATGLKIRQLITAETPMGSQTITSDFTDYKEVSGVKFAHKLNQDLGMAQLALSASKVEVNTNLSDALFEIK